ncbi:TetR/AcrR family transcriptional regulator [Streptomyces xanthii]|uniref:TetR/AcrR family transcriptional regulator n=1 Tax=Streptomyces xanthii TaxID=2768069 RepID=A0A7H1B1F9_9ACTN|nr:TetR/AcrR family transcriptional regulator [Streptomyces xanthii]QNS02564.1 TetR/AcrR family transcriptional regulator [Streptomyces xanthii]
MAAGRSGQPATTRRGSRAGGHSGSQRRSELLGIAAELFATRGYAQTTVRDIADEAGILSGSLYHHFSSKEEMLDEILREFLDPLLERFTAIEKQGENPEQVLDELVRHSFAAIHASPVAVALYQNELTMFSRQPGFEYVGRTGKKIEKIWLTVLKAGQKSGVFRPDVDVHLTYRFIRDAIWSTVRWYRPRGKYKHEAVAVQFLLVLHGGLHTA